MALHMERVAAGQRSALWDLYDHSKKTAYGLSLTLLGEETAACDTAASVLKTLWTGLTNGSLTCGDAAAWDTLLQTEIVTACKKALARRDTKAFRIPENRRFLLPSPQKADGDVTAAVREQFSAYQRLILALHTATTLTEAEQIALAKLDRRTWETALADERQNIASIGGDGAYDTVCEAMAQTVKTVKIPAALDETVAETIKALSAAYEKTHRKKAGTVIGCVAACCVVLCALSATLIWQLSSSTANTSGDGETTTTTTPVTNEEIAEALGTVGTVTTVENPTHYATIAIRDYGTIKVALDGNTAPKSVENFVKLAKSGFYEGLKFHRIIEGFMMQGGNGGPCDNVVGEFAQNNIKNPLSHVRGAISMARAADNNSGSSQFFIVHQDSTYLDGEYAAFGYVTEGMDVVDAVCTAAKPTDDNGTIPADEQPIIESITIEDVAAVK